MKSVLFSIVFVILGANISSQEWAPVGAKWFYTSFPGEWSFITENYSKFESVKDTIVSGKQCSMITKRKKVACNDRPDIEFMYSNMDTVFFYDSRFDEWQILYNFNVHLGNSWLIKLDPDPFKSGDLSMGSRAVLDTHFVKITVNTIDSIDINGRWLKKMDVTYDYINEGWAVGYPYNSTITELIGDINYMFNYLPEWAGPCDGDFSGGLRCYEDSYLGLYETGKADSCNHVEYWTSINEMDHEPRSFVKLEMDHIGNVINVTTDLGKDLTYEIYDLNGRILDFSCVNNNQIDIGPFGQGLYILKIFQNEQKLLHIEKFYKY